MSTVTQTTWEEYAAVIACGGKAFAFNGFTRDATNEEHAIKCLIIEGVYDDHPDRDAPHWVYFVLTE